ncbi:cation:proton antiporter [Methylococcus capsulatus]|uniref:cation:proton antiporter n=1 Tax=Methylococcus capsulatus TaxID=414 RepID=UPI00030EE9A1|nr:cation:proton antiporter [Methylococcus capsulatus]QXP88320.1 cation:proton antiporter [Methylococcus capsulatus]QXP94672.1 cation:proton antiporter [Methylococcus capsulatus]UQN13359.1 cation:proton antiporter [Methylococcus capsulatus]
MSTAPAAAVSVHAAETLLFFTLLQLAVIVLIGRIGGALAWRAGQSPVVGEIIGGIVLGPSLFGLLSPDIFRFVFRSAPPEPLTILSQLGLILLMFQIGLEFDFSHLKERRNRRAVRNVALVGLVLPFVLGLGFGYQTAPLLSPDADRLASALFIATAFSITALPILGRIMIEFGMTDHKLGVIAISVAAINDVVGWLLLALVTTLTVAEYSHAEFALKVGLVAAFIVLGWFVVRPVMKWLVRRFQKSEAGLPGNLLGVLLAGIFLAGMCTYKLGIFAIFGGFMMGVVLHDEPALRAAWKEKVGHFVTVFFLPIFFTFTGLRTEIGGLDTLQLWGWCALIILLATLGKLGGAYFAARLSGLSRSESGILGILMNTRGLMELIVLNVGYDLGVISRNVFTMLVLMAIVSTVLTTPCLRAWLPKAGFASSGRR